MRSRTCLPNGAAYGYQRRATPMFALQKCSPDRTVSESLLGELLDVVISRATYGPVVGGFPPVPGDVVPVVVPDPVVPPAVTVDGWAGVD